MALSQRRWFRAVVSNGPVSPVGLARSAFSATALVRAVAVAVAVARRGVGCGRPLCVRDSVARLPEELPNPALLRMMWPRRAAESSALIVVRRVQGRQDVVADDLAVQSSQIIRTSPRATVDHPH